MRLRTARLELIAATEQTVAWELGDLDDLITWLAVRRPNSWPPPLTDEASQQWYLDQLRRNPNAVGWCLWYIVRTDQNRELVGNVGFKGPPGVGSCEIGYSVLPEFHGHGYATEAVRALITWAFAQSDVNQVTAETLPDLTPSIRVMEKCGMQFVGEGNPEEGQRTVRYAISRARSDAFL